MKARLLLFSLWFLPLSYSSYAQVGVGNTNPQANLDITASSTTTPTNTDGILIPRMSAFPSSNPTAAQDGMLIFYTGAGAEGKGFYYWNNPTTSWVFMASGNKNTLDDAYDEGGAGAGRIIVSNDGDVEITGAYGLSISKGSNETNTQTLSLYGDIDGNANHGINNQVWGDAGAGTNRTAFAIDNYIRTLINNGTIYGLRSQFVLGNNAGSSLNTGNVGVFNQFYSGTNSGFNIGVQNEFRLSSTVHYGMKNTNFSTTDGITYGMHNDFDSSGSNPLYGTFNNFNTTATSNVYGSYSLIYGAGSGNKYGNYISIASASGGNHYGIYSDVRNALGYAAYFIGRTSLGTGATNRYLMPATDGTFGQIMSTNGSGQLSFVDASSVFTDTDNQTIDNFSFNSGTNVLTLEIEDDGVGAQTIDLSSLADADTDWLTSTGSSTPTSINDDIYTYGSVGIGTTSTLANLNIFHNTSSDGTADYLINNSVTNSGNDDKVIIRNSFGSAQGGDNTAIYNLLIGNGSGTYKGIENYSYASVTGDIYGLYNTIAATGNGEHYGARNYLSGSGNGDKYGSYNYILNTAGGTHYGIYSQVTKSGSYSGYFLGDVAIGTTTLNTYTLPSSRGSNGQIMQTDGAGNVSWVATSSVESTSASNGLSEVTDDIRLGGTLTQATTITQGTNSFDINLNSSGDFAVQDNGTDAFIVEDTGDVGFGTNNPSYQVDVVETGDGELRGINLTKTDNSTSETHGIYITKTGSGTGRSHAYYSLVEGTGTGQKYGMFNRVNSAAAGSQYAIRNWLSAATTATQFGVYNNLSNTGTGNRYGTYNAMRGSNSSQQRGVHNEFDTTVSASELTGVRNQLYDGTASSGIQGVYNDIQNASNSTIYGVRTVYQASASGTGDKYGSFNEISSSSGGTHYGTYNDVDTSNGWAGYFVGRNYISNRLSIGETNNDNARLNIISNSSGTTSHIELQENVADDGARIRLTNSVETNNEWLIYGRADNTVADSRFNINHTSTGNIIQVRGDGRVGINDNNPTYALELPNNATASVGQGRANAWVNYSDGRVKKDQQVIPYGLKTILKMNPKSYIHYSSTFEEGMLQLNEKSKTNTVGFIAQELFDILPEATYAPINENEELWSINYDKIIPVTVKAIQELNTKIETLEAENERLKAKLSKIEQLEARLLVLENNTNTNISTNTATTSEE